MNQKCGLYVVKLFSIYMVFKFQTFRNCQSKVLLTFTDIKFRPLTPHHPFLDPATLRNKYPEPFFSAKREGKNLFWASQFEKQHLSVTLPERIKNTKKLRKIRRIVAKSWEYQRQGDWVVTGGEEGELVGGQWGDSGGWGMGDEGIGILVTLEQSLALLSFNMLAKPKLLILGISGNSLWHSEPFCKAKFSVKSQNHDFPFRA